MFRQILVLFGVPLVVVLMLYMYFTQSVSREAGHEDNTLAVTFLDVGQGDAIFIESPTGTQVLIDGGPGSSVLRELNTRMGYFDRNIDLLIATHPDQDHIGGLIDVLTRYDVGTILITENESGTPVSKLFLERVEGEGATILYARKGQVFDLGMGTAGSTTLRILFPDRDPRGLESNMSSIVAKLEYGDVGFMLTGDSPQAIEEYLTGTVGETLESEVLKLGHHGSRTSSDELFVETVHPEYAIISAGKDNRYGHPHKEVTDMLAALGIPTKNTADVGSIIFLTDGVRLWTK